MNIKEKLNIEQDCLLTKSKAQMINLYIEKLEEIERLNNIINEYENDLKRYDLEYLHETGEHQLADVIEDMLDKLKELKESDNNENIINNIDDNIDNS